MIKIAALNDSQYSDDSSCSRSSALRATTKEAKEAQAFSLYTEALGLQQKGDASGAESLFSQLIQHPFLQQAVQLVEEEEVENMVHPGLQLLYSIYKNLALLASQRGNSQAAIKAYLEAVKIDSTEVTVWFKIGVIAADLHNYPLAKLAFEQGLVNNPNHWLCLDKVITISYALSDYWTCLYYISRALQRDAYYAKGNALRNAMFREQPSLGTDTAHMFSACDSVIYSVTVDKEEAKEYVAEAEAIRERIRELSKVPDPDPASLPCPISSYTWKCVGECFVDLYDKAVASNLPLGLATPVDLSDYSHAVADLTVVEVSSSDSCPSPIPMKVSDPLPPTQTSPLTGKDPPGNPQEPASSSAADVKTKEDGCELMVARKADDEKPSEMELGAALAEVIPDGDKFLKPFSSTAAQKMDTDAAVGSDAPGSSAHSEGDAGLKSADAAGREGKQETPATGSVDSDVKPVTLTAVEGRMTGPAGSNEGQPSGNPGEACSAMAAIAPSTCAVPPTLSAPALTVATDHVVPQAHLPTDNFSSTSPPSLLSQALTFVANPDVCVHPPSLSAVKGVEPGQGVGQNWGEEPNQGAECRQGHGGSGMSPSTPHPPLTLSLPQVLSPTSALTPSSHLPPQTGAGQRCSTPASPLGDVSSTPQLSPSLMLFHQAPLVQDSPAALPSPASLQSLTTPSPSMQATPPILSPYSTSSTPTARPTVAAAAHPLSHFTDPNRPRLIRRGPKRKQYTPEDYGGKRRSARVRNTAQRKEESVNFQEMLQKFLPSTLAGKGEREEDETMDDSSQAIVNDNLMADPSEASEENCVLKTEEQDVRAFVQSCVKNGGVIQLLVKFIVKLARLSLSAWPSGVAHVYLQAYNRIRKHLKFPDFSSPGEGVKDEDIADYALSALTWGELCMDEWMATHSRSQSPGNSQRGGLLCTSELLGEAFGRFCVEDFSYITSITDFPDILTDCKLHFSLRALWLQARLFILQNEMEDAVELFERILELIQAEEVPAFQVKLPNCQTDNVISKSNVHLQQESLQRCQSLEETQKLYNTGCFQQVVDILLQTFSQTMPSRKTAPYGSALPERHAQLLLLQESLFKLGDLEKCLVWGEASLNETLHHYRHARSSQDRFDWAATLTQICDGLNSVLAKDSSILQSLALSMASRLCQNLIHIIELTMDVGEGVSEMPISTVVPWILLYRLIKHEENKLEAMQVGKEEDKVTHTAISSSLMLLSVAHDYLGRHAWCTKSRGALLLFEMEVLQKELAVVGPAFREDVGLALEQCIYCLYGYPSKKTKARRLADHNAPPISLTWEKAGPVFQYFKPKTVAEFDSYKTSTVSADLESFLRRIFVVIPEDLSVGTRIEKVQAYIDGESSTAPDYQTTHPILLDLYYLLADYYFKNKEPAKAIKFYMYDLCVNSRRLDSWAGLALARMSQLEQKLSSMELKMDTPIHKKAIGTLRCFRRALEIDETTKKLWIEYGSLAYQLHSHSSRQLKLQKWLPLADDLADIASKMREDMLAVAQNCYWKASECEAEGCEEEWLHHYMMGKVKEKKGLHPRDVLEHYRQAALYLHEDGATYPKKIPYGQYSPHLAVEALEVYFRLHVCVLKQLVKPGGDVDLKEFRRYIDEAAVSPFALGREKKSERSGSVSVDESSCSEAATPAPKQRPVFHMTPPDHPYSRQKCSQDGFEGEASRGQTKDSGSMDSSVSQEEGGSRLAGSDHKGAEMEVEDKVVEMMEVVADMEVEVSEEKVRTSTFCGETEGERAADAGSGTRNDQANSRRTGPEVDVKNTESAEKSPTGGKPSGAGQTQREETPMDTDADAPPPLKPPSLSAVTSERKVSTAGEGSGSGAPSDSSASAQPTVSGDSVQILAPKSQSPKLAEPSSEQQDQLLDFPANLLKQRSEGFEVTGFGVTDAHKPMETVPEHQVQEKRSKATEKGGKEGEEKNGEQKTEERVVDEETERKDLLEKCIKALHLCLKRFPTHYKSLYRLAHVYHSATPLKNLQYARDLLFGNANWQQLDHMPCPGLFAERRHANFFQGLWRIPVEEIDRAGNFQSHVRRSVLLLLKVLQEMNDMKMLFFIHTQLQRKPDTGKKYLRDCERVVLHRAAFDYAVEAAEKLTEEMQDEEDDVKLLRFLMDVHHLWSHGVHKLSIKDERLNEMLAEAFAVARKNWEIDINQPLLEQAVKFCHEQQQVNLPRALSQSQSMQSSPATQPKSAFRAPVTEAAATSLASGTKAGQVERTAGQAEAMSVSTDKGQCRNTEFAPFVVDDSDDDDDDDKVIILDSPDKLTAEIQLLLSGENC